MTFFATTDLVATGPRDAVEDAVWSYVASLEKNGNIWGEAIWTWTAQEKLTITCLVPLESALEPDVGAVNVATARAELEALVGQPIEWRLRGTPELSRATGPELLQAPAFCLRTTMFDRTSPVVIGGSRESAPLYLLPLGERLREACVAWMRAYQAHDRIWIDSRDLESAAYAQMSSPDSELSRRGQTICADVERATGVPTYYFLYRYFVRDPRLGPEACPICKTSWSAGMLFERHLVCDACRLVSDEGVDRTRLP